MPWRAITVAEFLLEGFNPSERASVQAAAAGDDGLSEILTSSILQWRGIIEAAGNELDADTTTVPNGIRPYLVAAVRWQLLLKYPKLQSLQTEERKAAAERAEEIIDNIAKGDFGIEAPEEDDDDTDNTGGNWNSNPKIPMRTDISGERANEDS